MQNFISPISTNPDLLDMLEDVSKDTKGVSNDKLGRNKLIAEICTAFNLKVFDISKNGFQVHLVTAENNLYAGHAYAQHNGSDTIYYYSNTLITKQKGSANSNSITRDSKKITTLMANLKKHNEIPTEWSISNSYKEGIRSAFRSIGYRHRSVDFNIDNSLALIATKAVLGIDKDMIESNMHDLQACYDKYMNQLKAVNELKDDSNRFAKGFTAVGIMENNMNLDHTPTYYVIGEGSYDKDADEVILHAPLKRYETLANTHIASDAMMIRTYFEGKGRKENNEMNLSSNDHYFQDIDLAIGYRNFREIFALIPKHHE